MTASNEHVTQSSHDYRSINVTGVLSSVPQRKGILSVLIKKHEQRILITINYYGKICERCLR